MKDLELSQNKNGNHISVNDVWANLNQFTAKTDNDTDLIAFDRLTIAVDFIKKYFEEKGIETLDQLDCSFQITVMRIFVRLFTNEIEQACIQIIDKILNIASEKQNISPEIIEIWKRVSTEQWIKEKTHIR